MIRMYLTEKNAPCDPDMEVRESKGGQVGRLKLFDASSCESIIKIGLSLSYNDDDGTIKNDAIYILDPDEAVYCGWHLLRRGIVDYIKSIFKR